MLEKLNIIKIRRNMCENLKVDDHCDFCGCMYCEEKLNYHTATKHYTHHKKGFTLIELLIYMGLTAILLVILMELFSLIVNVQLESEKTSSVTQDGQYIMNTLTYNIHRAKSVDMPLNPGDSGSTLTLTIQEDGVDRTYIFGLMGNDLTLINQHGTNVINSVHTHVSNVQFTRVSSLSGMPTVQIYYTVTSVTQERAQLDFSHYKTSVGIR